MPIFKLGLYNAISPFLSLLAFPETPIDKMLKHDFVSWKLQPSLSAIETAYKWSGFCYLHQQVDHRTWRWRRRRLLGSHAAWRSKPLGLPLLYLRSQIRCALLHHRLVARVKIRDPTSTSSAASRPSKTSSRPSQSKPSSTEHYAEIIQ